MTQVDFALITIRPDEFAAVLQRFRTKVEKGKSGRTYGISQVPTKTGKNCSVAVVRCSEQGNDAAQQVANDVINDLDPQMLLVVGIAGGKTKCDYVVKELGFDACIDYKAGNLLADLREHCPKGVDVDFENVGGVILDTVLRVMNLFSRIVVCGLIAEYSATEPYGYKMLRSVLVNRIKMQGMIFFDWKDRYSEALDGLSGYLAEGKLKYRESIVDGIDKAPKGLIALLKGDNFGKQLVKLA